MSETKPRRKGISILFTAGTVLALAVCSWAQGSKPTPTSGASSASQAQSAPPSTSSPAPTLQRRSAATPAPPQVSPAEAQAYMAIRKEIDPNKQLQLVKDFEQKYPKSALLSSVLFFGAGAEEEKNDVPDALSYGKESLSLQPDNLQSLILVADLLPQPQAMQGTTAQKEQQLVESQNDASRALQLLKSLQPPSTLSPAQFERGRKMAEAQLHASLGMVHLQKALLARTPSSKAPDAAELGQAEQEFKTAVSSPQPNPQDYYRLGEIYIYENKLDDAIGAFTQAAQLGQGTEMETLAKARLAQLQALKAKSQPPAKQP